MRNNFGYLSTEPCRVCGLHKNNQSEPRFGYTVCEDHQDVPPTQIPPAPPDLTDEDEEATLTTMAIREANHVEQDRSAEKNPQTRHASLPVRKWQASTGAIRLATT